MEKVAVLLTSFNRVASTRACVETLQMGNPAVRFRFIIVDDGSTDGTEAMLLKLKSQYDIEIVKGSGGLYYSGGMRRAMNYLLEKTDFDDQYVLLINDDVVFYEGSVERILSESREKKGVIAGVTCGRDGEMTYGAVRFIKGLKYRTVGIDEAHQSCDTFNANCVLIPKEAFISTGGMDPCYVHSLGDFDYGLQLKKKGWAIYPSESYVGICERNCAQGTWTDRSLSIWQRIRLKEGIKGNPFKPWFHYLYKNFGLRYALLYSISPYVKMLFRK